ncbi:universal stress protein [Dactylosporangium sucinum]|uniref:Universal stress protein n=1 Tax=Dactylosporangium sucinum TaxID=1424081 RepID=A0A917X6F4_9ACTN|nr:universal stress protein [Dactylosporangium sucinum]GGM77210.1 universal stress protein [Dactylosporangium sucinum]GGM77967.1 universal stress protein [Dactylosporangium sucinum]
MSTESAVVVGVDGSPDARSAVEWAAADAMRRQRPLRIVHACLWPTVYAPMALPSPPAMFEETMREAAEQIVDEAVSLALDVAPGLDVSTDVPIQQPTAALSDASRNACLVVIGNRGLGGFAGLLLGSVGIQLAAHAECPVVIVRHADRPPGPEAGRVVVGVDCSHDAARALGFAFEQASVRGAGLTVVEARGGPVPAGPDDRVPLVYDPVELRADEERVLVEATGGWARRYPGVDVRRAVANGRPAAVLTGVSAGAALIVVGSRGRGGFTGLLLGSVSQALIHHAACPVAVIRATAARS